MRCRALFFLLFIVLFMGFASSCSLKSAQWSVTQADVGDVVELRVLAGGSTYTGDLDCTGKTIIFKIYEDDLIKDVYIDASSTIENYCSPPMISPLACLPNEITTWKVIWTEDTESGEFNPPEYYFTARVEGTSESIKSGNLRVNSYSENTNTNEYSDIESEEDTYDDENLPEENEEDVRFRYASWRCYNGEFEDKGEESSCKPSELWRYYAEDFCKNKCSMDGSKCGLNYFDVREPCGDESDISFEPNTSSIKETVTCTFVNSLKKQICYAQENRFDCSGKESCTIDVWSMDEGERLKWESSCEGSYYTTVDGNDESIEFICDDDLEESSSDKGSSDTCLDISSGDSCASWKGGCFCGNYDFYCGNYNKEGWKWFSIEDRVVCNEISKCKIYEWGNPNSAPKLRIESGFTFSNEVYDFFEYDQADSNDVRKQARLLKQAGVNQVQVYLLRWSEVDSDGKPFPIHDEINDRIVKILDEEGLGIHVEFFTHYINESGYTFFYSWDEEKNREEKWKSQYPINVPANQIVPLNDVIENGLLPQFYDYVYNTVKRYPQIKSWGFLNEVDAWGFESDNLIILQNTYYDAVKNANPDAMVGVAGPTFPEILAPPEKLNSDIFESLGYYYDENGVIKREEKTIINGENTTVMAWALDYHWKIKYPEVYDGWKRFYKNAKYDFVQIHQLGVGYWPNADWYYNTSYEGDWYYDPFLKVEKNSDSLRWELVRAGVDNVRQMVGDVPITSQVDVGVLDEKIKVGTPEYWLNVQSNFKKVSSGEYGFDFLDLYHLRRNTIDYTFYNRTTEKWETTTYSAPDIYLFNTSAEPSPLYDEVAKIYSDYSSHLNREDNSGSACDWSDAYCTYDYFSNGTSIGWVWRYSNELSESGKAACSDGEDNDCDGFSDEEDSDCSSPSLFITIRKFLADGLKGIIWWNE